MEYIHFEIKQIFWLLNVSEMLHKGSSSDIGLVTQMVKKIVWKDV